MGDITITQADFELIKSVFTDFKEEIYSQYSIDKEFMKKFELKE